jgi:hypothetical protein
VKTKDREIEQLKETIQRECEERTMMIISMSELKDQILKLRQQQSSSSTSVGTKEQFGDKSQLSQSFLNSLVHSIGPVGASGATGTTAGSSVYGLSSVPAGRTSSRDSSIGAGGTTFPSIVNTGGNNAKANRSVDEEDVDPAMSAAWAKNQNRTKKSRKAVSGSR